MLQYLLFCVKLCKILEKMRKYSLYFFFIHLLFVFSQGLTEENDPDPVMFGDYEFKSSDDNLQYFPVQVNFSIY